MASTKAQRQKKSRGTGQGPGTNGNTATPTPRSSSTSRRRRFPSNARIIAIVSVVGLLLTALTYFTLTLAQRDEAKSQTALNGQALNDNQTALIFDYVTLPQELLLRLYKGDATMAQKLGAPKEVSVANGLIVRDFALHSIEGTPSVACKDLVPHKVFGPNDTAFMLISEGLEMQPCAGGVSSVLYLRVKADGGSGVSEVTLRGTQSGYGSEVVPEPGVACGNLFELEDEERVPAPSLEPIEISIGSMAPGEVRLIPLQIWNPHQLLLGEIVSLSDSTSFGRDGEVLASKAIRSRSDTPTSDFDLEFEGMSGSC